MASGPSVQTAKDILNAVIGGLYFETPASVDVRLWTVAPTFDGSGGTEVVGAGYTPAVLSVGTAVNGGVGEIARILSDAPLLFTDMPVPSTSIAAASIHNHDTGALIWLNDQWSPPDAWNVGDSPLIPAGAFFTSLVPVSS